MNALKNLSLILLLSLAFTGCHNKSSKINDFNLLLYAPEYASGFDIKGAGGKESVLITVRNPWQGADSVTTWLFIVRNGEEVPEGFAGQVLKGVALLLEGIIRCGGTLYGNLCGLDLKRLFCLRRTRTDD